MAISSPSVERRPVDALAVDVDAVQRAVVEHAYTVRLVHHQRMTAGHGRVVEADVGRQRAADPRPFARDGGHDAPAARPRRPGTCRAPSGPPGPRRPTQGVRRRARPLLLGERHRPLAAERQGPGRLDFAGRAWIHQSLLWRAHAPFQRPDLQRRMIRRRSMGSRPEACQSGRGFVAPRRNSETMLSAASPTAPIERALLAQERRRCSPTRAPHCVHCHRTPLVGERVYLLRRADRLRAVPAAPPRGPAALRARALARSTSARSVCASVAPGRTPGAVDPVELSITHRPPARGGLRVPRRHREPPRVHRPLPQGVAPDAGRLLRPRRRRPLPHRRAAAALLLGRPDASWRSSRRAGSSPSAAAASSTASRPSPSWTLEPASGGTRVEFVFETEPALPTDRFVEAFGYPRLDSAQGEQGPAAAARHPRGQRGPRRAGDRRRAI